MCLNYFKVYFLNLLKGDDTLIFISFNFFKYFIIKKMKKYLLFSIMFVVSCSTSDKAVDKDSIYLNSFNRNPAPLYVLDGVIITSLDSLKPSSIAEVRVIKAKKAIDKYGQKGEDGVVEIITK
jgi:hypothetical protein